VICSKQSNGFLSLLQLEGPLLAGARAAGDVPQGDASHVAVSKWRSTRSSAYFLIGFVKQCSEGRRGKEGEDCPKNLLAVAWFYQTAQGKRGWTRSSRRQRRCKRQLAAFAVG